MLPSQTSVVIIVQKLPLIARNGTLRKRRKTNQIDARTLTSHLFNYLHGNEAALQLVRVPTLEQEQARLASRQHDQLVEDRKRLGAGGNLILLSQGFGSCKNWGGPKALSR